MAPRGATIQCKWPKNITNSHWTVSACHRYDQSLINILLAEKYNFNISKYAMPGYFGVVRRKDVCGRISLRKCYNVSAD